MYVHFFSHDLSFQDHDSILHRSYASPLTVINTLVYLGYLKAFFFKKNYILFNVYIQTLGYDL